jgi:5'-methylthioadenosine phosphorylase
MQKNYSISNPKIAIIGGSGLEDPKFFKKIKKINIKTSYGHTSGPINIVDFCGTQIAFLSRHGKNHDFPPHKVNFRANIWALKEIGVERIISVSAVGSLKANFKPGDIAILDQFIDFTKKREYTFYDNEVIHTSLADPFCPELRALFYKEAKKLRIPVHQNGTYLCIEGPRFSTRAESKFFRNFADVIGMTIVPEAVLAREKELCYISLAMVTDYDVWQPHPVNTEEVIKMMGKNIDKIQKLIMSAVSKIDDKRNCSCRESLKNAKI